MSYTIRVVDVAGKKKKGRELPDTIINKDYINHSLIHEYVVMYLANSRQSTAHTKTRGEVKGSGRKLYRQKGTGRARVGDAQSPIRRSGGVAFGPKNTTNWSKSMPKKMKLKAFFAALTVRANDDAIVGVTGMNFKTPKTSEATDILEAVGFGEGKTLVISTNEDTNVVKSFRNIGSVTTIAVNGLNAYNLLAHQNILFTESALDQFESKFTS